MARHGGRCSPGVGRRARLRLTPVGAGAARRSPAYSLPGPRKVRPGVRRRARDCLSVTSLEGLANLVDLLHHEVHEGIKIDGD